MITAKQLKAELRDIERVKLEIVELFGKGKLGAVIERLCGKCRIRDACRLYPITTKGEDCPYYSPKG